LALILIDIQKGFENVEYWGGQRNNLNAEKNASELLKLWRENNLPIFISNIVLQAQHLYSMKQTKAMNLMTWLNRLTMNP
jgi:nicotinamidase-related amidase